MAGAAPDDVWDQVKIRLLLLAGGSRPDSLAWLPHTRTSELTLVPNGDSAEDEKRRTHKPVARAGGDVLSTSDREIAIAVNLLPVAALIYDRDDGTIRHANPLFESLVGVTAGGCTGHRISDFYRDVAEHDEFISRLLREGVVGGRHVIGTLVDGDEVWLDTSSRWVVYADRPAVLTLFTNIDAEKRAQLASEIEQVQILGLAEISAIMASRRPGRRFSRRSRM